MRITVPLTGNIIAVDPDNPELVSGDPQDPVMPINFKKLLPDSNFGFEVVSFNFAQMTAELEINFARKLIPLTYRMETDDELLLRSTALGHTVDRREVPATTREETGTEFEARKAAIELSLRDLFEKKTIDELYQLSGEPRLKKPVGGPV